MISGQLTAPASPIGEQRAAGRVPEVGSAVKSGLQGSESAIPSIMSFVSDKARLSDMLFARQVGRFRARPMARSAAVG